MSELRDLMTFTYDLLKGSTIQFSEYFTHARKLKSIRSPKNRNSVYTVYTSYWTFLISYLDAVWFLFKITTTLWYCYFVDGL